MKANIILGLAAMILFTSCADSKGEQHAKRTVTLLREYYFQSLHGLEDKSEETIVLAEAEISKFDENDVSPEIYADLLYSMMCFRETRPTKIDRMSYEEYMNSKEKIQKVKQLGLEACSRAAEKLGEKGCGPPQL